MKTIYLDNAATTPMYPEVVEIMKESMLSDFGNPSSIHQFGRKAKVQVETTRKKIAKFFNVSAGEILFTSGGTEANNWVLLNAVTNLKVQRIVTSKIEHHAVLNVVKSLEERFNIEVVYVKLDEFGQIDLKDLDSVLKDKSLKTIVSLMMVNNEIGNLLPVKEVSLMCAKYNCLFHSDTVQAIGHYEIDLKNNPIDFIVASAHKFHGPKGVGFVYCNKKYNLNPVLFGGGQENGLRSGTENVHAIIGMGKALSLVYQNFEKDRLHVHSLKKYFVNNINDNFKGILFNGLSHDFINSSSAIVNVRFPVKNDKMMLFNMDLAGLVVSSGSACASGALKGSHVLREILPEKEFNNLSIRFSFSKMNDIDDLKSFLMKMKDVLCY